ncbi:hypothetical protein EV193_106167 [Herbihabitans rhizosphaerae]|uniref:Uncharacterized protein n=1 Tax=Herbihabitans rhizosphaerae TaxID=1872711 RepID=A0A4V2ESA9_9PSEU|nr:hypothetical protein EV193_106167 [Herbihabitans rhizosphaerae]
MKRSSAPNFVFAALTGCPRRPLLFVVVSLSQLSRSALSPLPPPVSPSKVIAVRPRV